MQSIYITGATGFVGRNFIEYVTALPQPPKIRCLVRDRSKADFLLNRPGIEVQYGDLLEIESFKRGLEDVDTVFHFAGLVGLRNGVEFYKANVDSTQQLIYALLEVNPHLNRLVYLSTIAAVDRPIYRFGGPKKGPISLDEISPIVPNTDYGRSKQDAEDAVTISQLPFTILRPPYIYGPHLRKDSGLDKLIETIKQGDRLARFPFPGRVSGIYIEDLCEAIWLGSQSPYTVNEAFFISNTDPLGIQEAIAEIHTLLEKPYEPTNVGAIEMEVIKRWQYLNHPDELLLRILFEDYFICSPRKFIGRTGFYPKHSFQEGLAKTIAWYQQNRWINA